MYPVCYGSLCLEGGDQIGKGDAFINLEKDLLARNIKLVTSSFPIYSTPIGTCLRRLLVEGFPKNFSNELSIRMILFALNRLEFLDVYLGNEKYHNSFLLLDRSPYSNALTISYALANIGGAKKEELQKYVNFAMNFDSLIISSLGLKRCVVQLYAEACNEQEWRGRQDTENEDMYEKNEVQRICQDVYEIFEKEVGTGWKKVPTRIGSNWRSREDILNDLNMIIMDTYGELPANSESSSYRIDFNEIVPHMYEEAEWSADDQQKYLEALEMNNKSEMYTYAVRLGLSSANSVRRIKFENEGVRQEFKKLVKVNGVLDLIGYFLGVDFVSKLIDSVEL